MARRWAVDASPLIILAKISRIELLTRLCANITIPAGVAREIEAGSPHDPAAIWLQKSGSKFVRMVRRIPSLITAWDLGIGETQVIAWAYQHHGVEVIIDDRAARRCAQALNIPVRGTLGILLLAKKEGLVPEVRSILDEMISVGFQISPEILKQSLALVNE